MSSIIEARGLTRRFGKLVAVDHVGFAVEEEEIFGFLGPNGAGKTTTLRMLTGVIEPTEGTAIVQGHDICEEPILARQHLAVVPEEANVYLDLSVWQNVSLMAELHGVPRRERIQEGRRLLELLGLADRMKDKARALSRGLRQRLMLVTALVTAPDILFLDEPTTGLDVSSARLIRQIVSELNHDGLTVFLTTHNMDEAEEMCARVAIINNGRIAVVDTPDRLRSAIQARQYVEVRFRGDGPAASELKSLLEVLSVRQTEETCHLYTESPGQVAVEVVRLADRRGLEIAQLATRKPTLEDVYLYFTDEGRREVENDGTS